MSKFQVHPHRGYLNTDIYLINNNMDSLVLVDKNTNKKYCVSPYSCKTIRLCEGDHFFRIDDPKESEYFETVFIEDAIKLGGGRPIGAYVSEKNNWALVKMTDRMYFHNIESGIEFIEYGLVPQEIDFLPNNHTLFYTRGQGYTVFSLKSFSPVFFSKTAPVFRNDEFIIFQLNKEGDNSDTLWIYNYEDFVSLSAEEYAINHKNNEIYIYNEGKISIKSLETLETIFIIPPYGSFLMFITGGFYISESINGEYSVFDIRNGNKEIGRLVNSAKYIKVLDRIILPKEDIEGLRGLYSELYGRVRGSSEKYISLSFSYAEILSFSLVNGNVYYVVKEYYSERFSVKNKTKIYRIGDYQALDVPNTSRILYDDKSLVISSFNRIEVYDNDECKKYDNATVIRCNDRLIIEQKLLNGEKKLSLSTGEELYTGFFDTSIDISDRDSINLLETFCVIDSFDNNEHYLVPIFNTQIKIKYDKLTICSGHIVLSSSIGKKYLVVDSDPRQIPSSADVIAISSNSAYILCRRTLSMKDYEILLLSWDEKNKIYIEKKLFSDLIDRSVYDDVVFAGDDDHIVYSDRDGNYHCMDLSCGSVIPFSSGRYLQSINGYRSVIKFASNNGAIPRTIDPVNGQFLSAIEFADYTFQSPDSSLIVIKAPSNECARDGIGFIEYKHKGTGSYVSKEEYSSLADEYNTRDGIEADQELKDKRLSLMKRDPSLFLSAIEKRIRSGSDINKEWGSVSITSQDIIDYSQNSMFFNKVKKEIIESFLRFTYRFVDTFIAANEYIVLNNTRTKDKIRIDIGIPLWFLNYISFSYDSKYISIVGRYPDNTEDEQRYSIGGLFLLYDLHEQRVVYASTRTKAVWISSFTKDNMVAYYDSDPNTYYRRTPEDATCRIAGRSFLTFSPSGKLMALSEQGYVRIDSERCQDWGHQPSTTVYIRRTDNPLEEIASFNDHGSPIINTCNRTVCMTAFSHDDSKLLSVSDDGVVVIRNLHL